VAEGARQRVHAPTVYPSPEGYPPVERELKALFDSPDLGHWYHRSRQSPWYRDLGMSALSRSLETHEQNQREHEKAGCAVEKERIHIAHHCRLSPKLSGQDYQLFL